jgi:hypothetical protein
MIKDRESLEDWLKGQSAQIAVVIAARVALRVSPCVARSARDQLDATSARKLADWTSAVFRACALTWVVAKYSSRANDLRPAAAATDAVGHAAAAQIALNDAEKEVFAFNAATGTAAARAAFFTAATAACAANSAANAAADQT